jgi:hypothetical protein
MADHRIVDTLVVHYLLTISYHMLDNLNTTSKNHLVHNNFQYWNNIYLQDWDDYILIELVQFQLDRQKSSYGI